GLRRHAGAEDARRVQLPGGSAGARRPRELERGRPAARRHAQGPRQGAVRRPQRRHVQAQRGRCAGRQQQL
ncbi:MAG: hypothetical protein AVDCRST_MAG54-1420, partial [uncultured Actinomycetospora sp.]